MTSRRLMIKGAGFALLVNSVLEKGVAAKFRVTGQSMVPNLIHNDVATICPYLDTDPQVGDVVALMETGITRIIIHRIIDEKNGLYRVKGDSAFISDGLFPRKVIAGYVSEVERSGVIIAVHRNRSGRMVAVSKFRFFCLVRIFSRTNMIKLKNKIINLNFW